jgi:hypothetical protein
MAQIYLKFYIPNRQTNELTMFTLLPENNNEGGLPRGSCTRAPLRLTTMSSYGMRMSVLGVSPRKRMSCDLYMPMIFSKLWIFLHMMMNRLWLQVSRHSEEAWAWDLTAGPGPRPWADDVCYHQQKKWYWDAQVSMPCWIHEKYIASLLAQWRRKVTRHNYPLRLSKTNTPDTGSVSEIWLSAMNRNDAGGEHCWDEHKPPCSG